MHLRLCDECACVHNGERMRHTASLHHGASGRVPRVRGAQFFEEGLFGRPLGEVCPPLPTRRPDPRAHNLGHNGRFSCLFRSAARSRRCAPTPSAGR